MKLEAKKVSEIFLDCLPETEDVNIDELIVIEGIVAKFGFVPEKIKKHKEEIIVLLSELPEEFRKEKGGGWSFLNACVDKEGKQWTGEHQIMEQLFCLGMAIGKVKSIFPREVWSAMPGDMPYYMILV